MRDRDMGVSADPWSHIATPQHRQGATLSLTSSVTTHIGPISIGFSRAGGLSVRQGAMWR